MVEQHAGSTARIDHPRCVAAVSPFDACKTIEQEIEIIVLTHRFGWTTDHILNQIVLNDSSERFFLAPAPALSKGGEEKELWFTLHAGRAVRVLVCVPRLLLTRSAPNVPPIPPARLCTVRGIPVMPLVPLLLLRLQPRRPTRAEREDISDVMHLLERARGGVAHEVRRAKGWLPSWFIAAGRLDVERYCVKHGLAYQASWFDLEAWLLDSDDEGNDERE